MEKCASHSVHAGESNATFVCRIGRLLTRPLTLLRLRPHHIGLCSTSLHMGNGKSTEIQKNVKKCAFDSAHGDGPDGVDIPQWVSFSFPTSKHPTHSVSTPHSRG